MSEDEVMIFESTEPAVVRAVETALTRAKLAFELRFQRPTLHEIGPNKPPKRFFVPASSEAQAREIVELAVIRRGRVDALQPKLPRPASMGGDAGGSFLAAHDFDFSGGDGDGCD